MNIIDGRKKKLGSHEYVYPLSKQITEYLDKWNPVRIHRELLFLICTFSFSWNRIYGSYTNAIYYEWSLVTLFQRQLSWVHTHTHHTPTASNDLFVKGEEMIWFRFVKKEQCPYIQTVRKTNGTESWFWECVCVCVCMLQHSH